jgi:predicted ABC-type ATPase
VPTAKIIARYLRTLPLLPRAVELANVAYIFDNTQTAELILQAIDGSLNMLKPTVPNWVETGLISPYAQRSLARQEIEMFVSDRKLELEFG